jgi:hypothetical protein
MTPAKRKQAMDEKETTDNKLTRTGFYKVKRTIEVTLTPLGYTEQTYRKLCLAADLERARHVPEAMALMHKEYVALAKRTLERMPGEMCGSANSILTAIRQDPLVSVVTGQNPDDLFRIIEKRLRENEMPVPECLKSLTMWGTLVIQYHWRFADLFGLNLHSNGDYSLPARMSGQPKASLAELMPEFSEKFIPAQPFDRSRILFDNRLLGISWREEAIERSRLFLLKDGGRMLVGAIPRGSSFNPFTLRGEMMGGEYGLFDVSADGQRDGKPMFRPVSRVRVDAALGNGEVMLFAVTAKRRDDGDIFAALFSDENAERGVLRLLSDTQFFLRQDALRGSLEFSATFLVSFNHHLRTLHAPKYTIDESVFHQARPECRIVPVDASALGDHEALDEICRQLTAHDIAISLPEGTRFETVEAIRKILGYIVLPTTPYLEPGGALCGFQFPDRVLVKGAVDQFSSGKVWYETRERQAANLARQTEAAVRREEAARQKREAHERRMAEQKRQAEERKAAKQLERQRRAEEEQRKKEEASRKLDEAFAALKIGSSHFSYYYTPKGSTSSDRREGDMFADSREEAYSKLRAVGINPIKVYPFGEESPAKPAPGRNFAEVKARQEAMTRPMPAAQPSMPSEPQPPAAKPDPMADRLGRLKKLYDLGIISETEYADQRKRILAEL